MKQFEVGKVYKQLRGNSFIKVTKRTESNVWYVYVTLMGKEYTLDSAYKRIRKDGWHDSEWFCDNDLHQTFLAEDVISDEEFEARKAAYRAAQDRVAAACQAALDKQVKELRKWLKESCISMRTVDAVLDRFSGVSESVLKELRNGD